MRYLLLHILVLLAVAVPALADDIMVVQSSRNKAYDEILRGFRGVCGTESRLVVLSDYAEVDVPRLVREERPRLVVALGDEALAATRKLRHSPVLAVMSLGINPSDGPRRNLTGVDLFVSPERYMDVFEALDARRIGVVFDPSKTGWYVRRAEAAAHRAGLKIVAWEVRSPREVMKRLDELKGKVDALWVIPDTTAVVRETLDAIFAFSLQHSVPVVSFTAAHLQSGAAAVLDIDRQGLGRQAGEMAMRLLHGATPDELAVAAPRAVNLRPNRSVLDNLRLPRRILDTLTGSR